MVIWKIKRTSKDWKKTFRKKSSTYIHFYARHIASAFFSLQNNGVYDTDDQVRRGKKDQNLAYIGYLICMSVVQIPCAYKLMTNYVHSSRVCNCKTSTNLGSGTSSKPPKEAYISFPNEPPENLIYLIFWLESRQV